MVTQDFWTRVDMKKKSVTMVGVWKQECGDQKLSKKKTKFMKILLMKWLIEEFKFGMKSKICDSGCTKNKKEAKYGDPKERLNEVKGKSCVWIAWGYGWQVEAVLGQPGWSWISPRYQQNTHTHTHAHIHTNNHNWLASQLWVCDTTQQAWQQAAGVAVESVIWTHQGDIN